MCGHTYIHNLIGSMKLIKNLLLSYKNIDVYFK